MAGTTGNLRNTWVAPPQAEPIHKRRCRLITQFSMVTRLRINRGEDEGQSAAPCGYESYRVRHRISSSMVACESLLRASPDRGQGSVVSHGVLVRGRHAHQFGPAAWRPAPSIRSDGWLRDRKSTRL